MKASSLMIVPASARSLIWASGGMKSLACLCLWAVMPSAATLALSLIATVQQALRDSIQHALDHREQALAYAMQFARDLDPHMADRFVGMYVNNRTLDYGEDGKEAVSRLLNMGYRAGIITREPHVEFV